jgi:hypothetical protein
MLVSFSANGNYLATRHEIDEPGEAALNVYLYTEEE